MSGITTSMTDYMKNNPKLKYLFFGGKGGVGKTIMAGASALWFAKQGKKTLLASTNPVHSLSNLLNQDVFGKPVLICDEKQCFAFEIDTKESIERSKQEIREKIAWFLKFADITIKAEEFVESATMNPAFEESAMFENMIDRLPDQYRAPGCPLPCLAHRRPDQGFAKDRASRGTEGQAQRYRREQGNMLANDDPPRGRGQG